MLGTLDSRALLGVEQVDTDLPYRPEPFNSEAP